MNLREQVRRIERVQGLPSGAILALLRADVPAEAIEEALAAGWPPILIADFGKAWKAIRSVALRPFTISKARAEEYLQKPVPLSLPAALHKALALAGVDEGMIIPDAFREEVKQLFRLDEPALPPWVRPGALAFSPWRGAQGLNYIIDRIEGGFVFLRGDKDGIRVGQFLAGYTEGKGKPGAERQPTHAEALWTLRDHGGVRGWATEDMRNVYVRWDFVDARYVIEDELGSVAYPTAEEALTVFEEITAYTPPPPIPIAPPVDTSPAPERQRRRHARAHRAMADELRGASPFGTLGLVARRELARLCGLFAEAVEQPCSFDALTLSSTVLGSLVMARVADDVDADAERMFVEDVERHLAETQRLVLEGTGAR